MGCAAVMPLGAPIGSGMGIRNPANLRIIATSNRRHLVPKLVSDNRDAGLDDRGELHVGEAIEGMPWLLALVVGLAVLLLGAHWFVDGAVAIVVGLNDAQLAELREAFPS